MIATLEVDAVPALYLPGNEVVRAGLVFRVGSVDETLARRGITHLVHHLVLDEVGGNDGHVHGTVGAEHTTFQVRGSAEDAVRFLTGVCAALRHLPEHRLSAAKETLLTEARTRRYDSLLPAWRHGARDYGLAGYPEFGVHGSMPDDLDTWVARYFTSRNAALWVVADALPAGLRLDLPTGSRRPAPAPSTTRSLLPAYVTGSSAGVRWDTVVPQTAGAAVFTTVLDRRLSDELGQDAVSFAIRTAYEPRADGTALITAAAHGTVERRMAVLGGFADALAGLRAGRIVTTDVASAVEKNCDDVRRAEANGEWLREQAVNLLSGRPVQTATDALARLRSVTTADVVGVAAAAYRAGLLATPAGTDAQWAGYTPASLPAAAATVTGTAYRARGNRRRQLIVGDDGVTLMDGRRPVTVRFGTCAAVLAWPDGGRQLIGDDTTVVRVEPGEFPGAHTAIDARTPAGLRVDLPARDPGSIPAPVHSGSRRLSATNWRLWWLAGSDLFGPAVVTLLFAYLSLTFLSWVVTAPELAGRGLIAGGITGAVAGWFGRRTWRIAQRFVHG